MRSRARSTRFRPVAARANLSAPSIASVPELQKNTASRCGGVRFVIASASNPLKSEQSICTMFGRSRSSTSRMAFCTAGMIAADVENAVAAQEIQIRRVIHVVEIRALGSRIDLVETDDALCRHQRPVQMTLMQLVILAQARGDDFFQVKDFHGDAMVLRFEGLQTQLGCVGVHGRMRSRASFDSPRRSFRRTPKSASVTSTLPETNQTESRRACSPAAFKFWRSPERLIFHHCTRSTTRFSRVPV